MDQPVVNQYHNGLNQKLLEALPRAARVLECGCANGRLGQAYKERYPGSTWNGIEIDRNAARIARRHLDQVFERDLDCSTLADVGTGYDLLVLGDVIEHLRDPARLLARLRELGTEHAKLICCVPNMSHIQVIERLLAGDLTYEASGLLDRTHLRFLSPRSVFKLLLDAGWMPALTSCVSVGPANLPLAHALVAAAATMGIPAKTAGDNLSLFQMIIDCSQSPAASGSTSRPVLPRKKITVVVPVNDELLFRHNIGKSPGLQELDVELIVCRGAENAAAAYLEGLAQASADWIIFCHQDIYFPRGFGVAMAAFLDAIPAASARRELFGFAGIGTNPQQQIFEAGFVIDRLGRFDNPAASHAISIDELAIVVSRDTVHRLDPDLGWHLWATDLCLQAEQGTDAWPARIVRLPLYHNSNNDGNLPPAFDVSSRLLLKKYPNLDIIPTLCKCLDRF